MTYGALQLPQGQPLSSPHTIRASQQTDSIFYLIRSLWTLVGRSRPFQRLDCVVRLSPHWTSLSLQRVVDECEECLGEGPLDFRIVQEKIALS